jgi:hypothetical protein
MEVVGAGFPRTGTSTLDDALTRLGFGPCHHAKDLIGRPEKVGQWLRAYAGERVDFRALLAGYRASTDAPGCFFWRELMDEFPQARVILCERDPQSWYASMSRTILRQDLFDGPPDPSLADLRRLSGAMFEHVFGNRLDEAHLVEVFERHNAEVRRAVPAGRLLVYEVSQGWEPLCRFLGVDVPDEPFPWLNDSAQFVSRIEQHRRRIEPE